MPGEGIIMTKDIIKYQEKVKPLRLYWIYTEEGYFLGGGPCPVGKEKLANKHLKWCRENHHGAYLEWEPGYYTYKESYVVSRNKAEQVQRDQPGIRECWNSFEMSAAISNVIDLTEVPLVRVARKADEKERILLGTNDQKVIDQYREKQKQLGKGIK